MGDVVGFQKPEISEPHLSGKAKCLCCKHEWVAIAPVGNTILECPKCDTANGTWYALTFPGDGMEVWFCKCGNGLYSILKDGRAVCARCGETQTW